MGMIPDPRQIGDGGGDGPPIPGKSGMAAGMGIGGSVPCKFVGAEGCPPLALGSDF